MEYARPAIPAKVPLMIYAMIRYLSTLTPESRVASLLLPSERIYRPVFVLFNTMAIMTAAAIRSTKPVGISNPPAVLILKRKRYQPSGSEPDFQVTDWAPVIMEPIPFDSIIVPRVAIKGGSPILDTSRPFIKPKIMPMRIQIIIVSHIGKPLLTLR